MNSSNRVSALLEKQDNEFIALTSADYQSLTQDESDALFAALAKGKNNRKATFVHIDLADDVANSQKLLNSIKNRTDLPLYLSISGFNCEQTHIDSIKAISKQTCGLKQLEIEFSPQCNRKYFKILEDTIRQENKTIVVLAQDYQHNRIFSHKPTSEQYPTPSRIFRNYRSALKVKDINARISLLEDIIVDIDDQEYSPIDAIKRSVYLETIEQLIKLKRFHRAFELATEISNDKLKARIIEADTRIPLEEEAKRAVVNYLKQDRTVPTEKPQEAFATIQGFYVTPESDALLRGGDEHVQKGLKAAVDLNEPTAHGQMASCYKLGWGVRQDSKLSKLHEEKSFFNHGFNFTQKVKILMDNFDTGQKDHVLKGLEMAVTRKDATSPSAALYLMQHYYDKYLHFGNDKNLKKVKEYCQLAIEYGGLENALRTILEEVTKLRDIARDEPKTLELLNYALTLIKEDDFNKNQSIRAYYYRFLYETFEYLPRGNDKAKYENFKAFISFTQDDCDPALFDFQEMQQFRFTMYKHLCFYTYLDPKYIADMLCTLSVTDHIALIDKVDSQNQDFLTIELLKRELTENALEQAFAAWNPTLPDKKQQLMERITKVYLANEKSQQLNVSEVTICKLWLTDPSKITPEIHPLLLKNIDNLLSAKNSSYHQPLFEIVQKSDLPAARKTQCFKQLRELTNNKELLGKIAKQLIDHDILAGIERLRDNLVTAVTTNKSSSGSIDWKKMKKAQFLYLLEEKLDAEFKKNTNLLHDKKARIKAIKGIIDAIKQAKGQEAIKNDTDQDSTSAKRKAQKAGEEFYKTAMSGIFSHRVADLVNALLDGDIPTVDENTGKISIPNSQPFIYRGRWG